MTTTAFDALAYFEKLKAAGVPEEQAKVQARAIFDKKLLWRPRQSGRPRRMSLKTMLFRRNDGSEAFDFCKKLNAKCSNAFRDFSAIQEENARQELATKGDIQDVRLEIEKVRGEIKSSEIRLLKWQWGIALALAVIMARGFGWIGF